MECLGDCTLPGWYHFLSGMAVIFSVHWKQTKTVHGFKTKGTHVKTAVRLKTRHTSYQHQTRAYNRVWKCYIHRRSVAVLYKIRCNQVHPLNGALPGPYVPARVTRGALVAHRYINAPPRCRTLQYSRTFIPFSVSLWNDLANPVFDGVGLAGFKSRANASLLV